MSIVSYDACALIDRWMELERNGNQFPVDFDIAWTIAGYSTKQKAQNKLKYLKEGEDFLTDRLKTSTGGRPSKLIEMTCDAFKHFCLLAETEEGRNIRQYFIEAEKKWEMVKSVAPEFAQQIELAKIQYELEREKNRGKELDNTMLQLHGDRVVLALRGQSDIIVEKETVITEVLNPQTGETKRFLSADQLKKAIKERTGQKLKSMKQFTDALREKGRDDLLLPVERPQVYEYVQPEKLDEAIKVVYRDCRQTLLGE